MYVYVCVFFYKQKTAYEMRISDWSSDVCSSDLCGLVRVHAYGLGQITVAFVVAGHLLAQPRQDIEGIPVVSRSQRFGNTGKFQQIGRASCRERVCQYV